MAISDILSTSFLFSIAIIIILIGGVFAYVSYRMGEQDHKLNSMIGLVSTMAEESQFFRSKLNMLQQKLSTKDLPVVDQVQYASQMMVGGQDELINVSDDEEDDSDDDESDDLEDDESEDLEEEDLEDEDLEDEDLEDDESKDLEDEDLEDDESEDLEEGRGEHIKRLNLTSAIDESPVKISYEEIDEDNNSFKETNNLVFDDIADFEATLEEADIQLLAEDTKDDDNFLKNVSITGLDNGILSLEEIVSNKNDYKKMSLNKLREVVVSKGFTSDASHLKKNQILKLLGDE
jgi:hypothetical protein